MRIIIFGASGKTGQELVRQGLDAGYSVTAFVRDPGKLNVQNDALRVYTGAIDNVPEMIGAIRGHDAVLSALGAANPMKYDPLVVKGIYNICLAMQEAGVQNLIYLSPIAVRESRRDAGFFMQYLAPILLRTEIRGHEEREQIIRASLLKYTIVRAPFLTMEKYTGSFRVGTDIQYKGFLPKLSRADVAAAMLAQVNVESPERIIRVLPL